MSRHLLQAGITGLIIASLNLALIMVGGGSSQLLAIPLIPGMLIVRVLGIEGTIAVSLLLLVTGTLTYGGVALLIIRRKGKSVKDSATTLNLR
jgi:hypothetical protein